MVGSRTPVRWSASVRMFFAPGSALGSIHAFLRAVRHAGFEGASFPLGIDDDGRERRVSIDGEVPCRRVRTGACPIGALASIARLLRGLHDAARSFNPQGLTWNDALADLAGGTLVCHNEVEPSERRLRYGIAVALLDFELWCERAAGLHQRARARSACIGTTK
jgi:hypothetical protein